MAGQAACRHRAWAFLERDLLVVAVDCFCGVDLRVFVRVSVCKVGEGVYSKVACCTWCRSKLD